ncbi:MAG: putative 3-methyladenine glycosylase [Candidatus Acidoferrum typicum]|nr:putative 3-methyladenine glycosylase [Candidatus Acidoferrum typicum]
MRGPKTPTPLEIRRLRRSELPTNTLKLARYLIGKTLVHDSPSGRMSGRIVETEAYPIGDAAGHAFGGETPSRRSLFLERGRCYVYFTYGSCFMVNVSSEKPSIGAGVLLRALEPLEGIPLMERHRGTERLADLTRGPGRLAKAMNVDKRFDGVDLCGQGALWLGAALRRTGEIGISIRIGITRQVDQLYRFYERANPFVSGLKRLRE